MFSLPQRLVLIGIFLPEGLACRAEAPKGTIHSCEKAIKPIVFLTGKDSRELEPGTFLISSREDWEKLWKTHQDGLPMDVDFEHYMVVAVFQGKHRQSLGLEIDSLTES